MSALIFSFFRALIFIDLYKNLSSQKVERIKSKPFKSLLLVSLFVLSTLIHINFKHLLPLFCIPLFSIYACVIFHDRFDLSFFLTTIAYSIYYVNTNAISLFLTTIFSPFFFINMDIPYNLIYLLNGILTYLVSHALFKLKKIKSGVSILKSKSFISIGIVLSFLILFIKVVDCLYISSSKHIAFLPFITILLAFLLFTWWRKQITKSYIEKLRKLEVQSLYDELEEKERQIQKLASDNESLARIVHKDNKLIPAMEHAVTNFLSSDDFHDPVKASQYGMELTQKLRNIAMERQGTLDTYDNENHKLRLTGHVSLDAILVYMSKKADANHISFECRHTPENIDYLLTKISEDDLTHLLSDLMENAIIAMRGLEDGRLQITFGKFQKEAYISIADNGIPFDIATLHSFGLQAHTTHTDSGGSGIGLMDIWKIKRKYRATIQIQEYENLSNSFSKRVLFSFNSKNHYVIQSFRHEEIRNTQTRGDLYLIPAEAKEKNEGKQHERNTETLNS